MLFLFGRFVNHVFLFGLRRLFSLLTLSTKRLYVFADYIDVVFEYLNLVLGFLDLDLCYFIRNMFFQSFVIGVNLHQKVFTFFSGIAFGMILINKVYILLNAFKL